MVRVPLSVVVVSYNRRELIGTCLRAVAFADEIIVVDKSSTDGTDQIARQFADRVVSVPWTPTVEDTRVHAVGLARHDWILLLDDDELLSVGLARAIGAIVTSPEAEIYALPRREYIIGLHDPDAYYWPEYHNRLFRRDAVDLPAIVHGGINPISGEPAVIAPDGDVCIHHLSHATVEQWYEKTNRYTSVAARLRLGGDALDVAAAAHAAIDRWLARTREPEPGSYRATVAVLRATYDMIDRLKSWEEDQPGPDGPTRFAAICAELDMAHAAEPVAHRGAAPVGIEAASPPSALVTEAHADLEAARAKAALLGRAEAAERAAAAALAQLDDLAARFATIVAERDHLDGALAVAHDHLAAIEDSRWWRAGGPIRRLVDAVRGRSQ